MLTKKTLLKFSLAVAAQIVIVLVMILFKYSVFAGGQSVFLHAEPFDPRDPLRGDYMVFTYDISEIQPYYFANYNEKTGEPIEYKVGDTVYVALNTYRMYSDSNLFGRQASVSLVSLDKPTSGLFIKGVITEKTEPVTTDELWGSTSEMYRVKYGIEDYFIPENSGHQRDLLFRDDITAQVMVDDNGNVILKQMYVGDKKWP